MTKFEKLTRVICIRGNRCFSVSPKEGDGPVVTCVAARFINSGDELEIELVAPYNTDGIKDASTITIREADISDNGNTARFISEADSKLYLLTTFE
jgi:hypothetical protein